MGGILRGISVALLMTILILLGGLLWTAANLGSGNMSLLVDAGVVVSCLTGGFWAGKETKQWAAGAAAGAGYVLIGVLILALFLPVNGTGMLEVLLEGGAIGLVGGALGAGLYRGNTGRGGRPWGGLGRDYPGKGFTERDYGKRDHPAQDGVGMEYDDDGEKTERWANKTGNEEEWGYPVFPALASDPNGKAGGDRLSESVWSDPFGSELRENDPGKQRTEKDERSLLRLSENSPWWDEPMNRIDMESKH